MKRTEKDAIWRQILELMRSGPVLPLDVAAHLYKNTNKTLQVKAHLLLDEMWDVGLCYCQGEFRDYKYAITYTGEQFLNG